MLFEHLPPPSGQEPVVDCGGGVVCGWFGVYCFSSCSGCFGVVWIGGDACFLGVSGGCVVWFTVGGFALLAWLV